MTNQELRQALTQLRAGTFTGDVYRLIHEFGNSDFLEAKGAVEKYLQDDNPSLRAIALNVLVLHWGFKEYENVCIGMIADEDSDVRRMACSCVGSILVAARSAKGLRALLQVCLNEDEASDVRDSAYVGVLRILGVPSQDLPSAARSLRWWEDIDREKISQATEIVNAA